MTATFARGLLLVTGLAAAGAPVVVGRSTPPPLPPPTASVDGAVLYRTYCQLCHGAEGKGYAADNAPSLVSATFLATAPDEFLRAGIGRGRPGTAMAGYARAVGGPLTPAQIDALIAHLRKGQPAPVPLPGQVVVGDAGRGKAIYDRECAKCHGTVHQRMNAVHLANPVLLATASDVFLRHAVVLGRPETPMIAFAGKLGDRQINDVVAYVRSLAVAPAVPARPPVAGAGGDGRPPRTGPVVLNPRGKPADFQLKDGRLVSLDALKAALDQKRRLVIVDARAPSDWLNLHIKGAISTPYYDLGSLDDIPNDGTWVIAYCACPHHASGVVVDELRRRGHVHSAVLDEGIFAWQGKGYPVVQAPGMLPVAAPPKPPAGQGHAAGAR
jgi:cytochrome c oxidase cbb3-type subunit 3/ubiquinol-cytochrome c reductase cytochrome c subunit